MSAFIVNTNVMAKSRDGNPAQTRRIRRRAQAAWHYSLLRSAPTGAQKEAGTKIGQKLFRLNRRALRARYGSGEHLNVPKFVFENWADATPVEQFKAMCCVLYQCCEGDVPNSRLYDELNHSASELAQSIVQDPQEYEKASWGDRAPPASSAAVEEVPGVGIIVLSRSKES